VVLTRKEKQKKNKNPNGSRTTRTKKSEILTLLGIATCCTLGIIFLVKLWEWAGGGMLAVREARFALTQVDVLIVAALLFGGGIFGALLLLRKFEYIFAGGGAQW